MAETLEKRLYKAIKESPNSNTVEELIEQGVDCNLSHFDEDTLSFMSPIHLAIKNDRHRTLPLLYEHRNSQTITQLEKHITFYVNHHVQLQDEENERLFDYTVSRLLYTRLTERPKKELHTLIAALHDYDNAELRGVSLCKGSTHQILLQLRVYTLFQRIIEMTINSGHNMIEVIEDELLHNLETHYFLDGIFCIPVVITREMISKKFTEIKSSHPLLIRYYQCIAENLTNKIQQLEINEEYTIPTGWIEHAVCVSFRRISETHISVRIDNPSPENPPNVHETVHSTTGQEDNLDYFISLVDSVKRDLTFEEGYSLIYNLNGQIRNLDGRQIENVPSFDIQAYANCFVKCFEPGFRIRLDRTHHKLCEQLLLSEENNANKLAKYCEEVLLFKENDTNLFDEGEEYLNHLDNLYSRFNLLTKEDNINSLPVPEKKRLQYQLKTSYKQHYQYLLGNRNSESSSRLIKKYVPLRFNYKETSIKLKDFFIKSRVLLLGEAGYGKTTVCQYVTYRWACNKIWENKFEWLFYIKMRNLNSKLYPSRLNNYSLIDIIEGECFQGYKLNDLDKKN